MSPFATPGTSSPQPQPQAAAPHLNQSAFASGNAPAVPTVYIELDFHDVTARKAAIIRKSPLLQKCVAGRTVTASEIAAGTEGASSSPTTPTVVAGAAADSSGALGGASAFSASAGTHQVAAAPPGPPAAALPGAHTSSHGSHVHADIKYSATPGGGCDVHARSYRLATADLRNVGEVEAALHAAGCDFSLPTLLLSECVLVYLEPEESCSIIAWAARAFARSVFVTYEQVRPHDAFGQMMMRNLEERGYSLRGLHAFPDLASQVARYKELGYQACSAADMNDIYYRLLPRVEVARIERLELFDEVEEWARTRYGIPLTDLPTPPSSNPRLRASNDFPRSLLSI